VAEANANVRHRLEKMVRHKLKHNESWCGESQQERLAQAGKNLLCAVITRAGRLTVKTDGGNGCMGKMKNWGGMTLRRAVERFAKT
jgi:hypothetical protein